MPDDATLISELSSNPAAPSPAPSPSPLWVGEDGNFSEGWLDRLPSDLAEAKPTAAKYRSVPELVKAHHSLQTMLGKKSNAVTIPGEGAKPEEVSAFRKALGVPDAPEQYQLKPEKLPDGVEWHEDTGKTWQKLFHENNIPAPVASKLVQAYTEMEGQRAQEMVRMAQEELSKGEQALKAEFKGNYEANITLATRAAKTVGLDPHSPGLRDPEVVKAFVRMGKMLSEDKLVDGGSATAAPGKARAMAIMTGSDQSVAHLHKLYKEGDPETAKMVTQMLAHG